MPQIIVRQVNYQKILRLTQTAGKPLELKKTIAATVVKYIKYIPVLGY